jgi:Co/Zn/Cd efflux system component
VFELNGLVMLQVFGFAVAGIVFDILSLAPFIVHNLQTRKARKSAASIQSSRKTQTSQQMVEHPSIDPEAGTGHSAINMFSAVTHIFSDFLRSSTTLVAALLIWIDGMNSTKVDAYAALIVASIILFGLLGAIIVWMKKVYQYFQNKGSSSYADLTTPIVSPENGTIGK